MAATFSWDTFGDYTPTMLDEVLHNVNSIPPHADTTADDNDRPFDLIIIGGESFSLFVAQQVLAQDPTQRYRILVLDSAPPQLTEPLPNTPTPDQSSPSDLSLASATAIPFGTGGVPWRLTGTHTCPCERRKQLRGREFGAIHFLEGAADSELPREHWPTNLVQELNHTYFSRAIQQLGSNQSNSASHNPLQSTLRDRLFAALTTNRVNNAYPLAELPDHALVLHSSSPSARSINKKDLHRLLGILPGDTRLSRGDLLNLLKLETPLMRQSPPPSAQPLVRRRPELALPEVAPGPPIEPTHAARWKRLAVIPNCQVTRLETTIADGKTRVKEVHMLTGGIAHRVPVPDHGIVVIGLDAIQSARLALLSFPPLPNSNLIGRNLMSHLCSSLTIRIPQAALPTDLSQKRRTSVLTVKGRKLDLAGVRHFHLQITAASMSTPTLSAQGKHRTKFLDPSSPATLVITIRGVGEMEPQNPANRVTLDSHLDDNGLLSTLVQLTPTVQDLELWDAMDQAADDVAQVLADGSPYEVLVGRQFQPVAATQAAQTILPFAERRSKPDATFHGAGTLWMGDDPNTSVTNSHGRFHYITNTYALGPCLFPTIGARDPFLTSTALACYLANHLLGSKSSSTSTTSEAG